MLAPVGTFLGFAADLYQIERLKNRLGARAYCPREDNSRAD